MKIPGELQLAKDFIGLSILISPEKKFLLPDCEDNKNQTLLYKAISELQEEGVININLTTEGTVIILK